LTGHDDKHQSLIHSPKQKATTKLQPSPRKGIYKSLRVKENDYAFLNRKGDPLNFQTWRSGAWYRILRGFDD
jgi:hypothetical protein